MKLRKLNRNDLNLYEQWSLEHFHNKEKILDSTISLTFNLNLTNAIKNYESLFKNEQSSLTSFLFYKLSRSIGSIPCLNYRDVNGSWFQVEDPPIFIPIAVGGEQRFSRIFIENPNSMTWRDFSTFYRQNLDQIKKGNNSNITIEHEKFLVANIMGNLPNIQFTSFGFHKFQSNSGRQAFYMGKRFHQENKVFIPFHVSLDHANADPFILDELIVNFEESLLNEDN